MAADYLTFFQELSQRFDEIGSIFPSSRFLSRIMARPIKDYPRPVHILEVGPGTGPFTRQILKWMGNEDRLTVCEINPRLLRRLKENLVENDHFLRHAQRVAFFEGSIQDFAKNSNGECFDVIVCSLPFSIFTPECTLEIMGILDGLLAEEGSLSFFEYLGMRKMGQVISGPRSRKRLRQVEEVIKRWQDEAILTGELSVKVSLLNLPPAKAIRFRHQPKIIMTEEAIAV